MLSLKTMTILLSLAVLLAGCAQPESAPVPEDGTRVAEGVPIIFDTDLGYDCDDAGALAVLHALADRGEANILATVTVVGDPHSAGALDVINSYYGRPDTPVGAYQGERWADAHPYWLTPDTGFLETLVSEYESDIETKAQARDAVLLYREVLAAQKDASVTVVAVGFLQNLANLLRSPGDRHSPLTGRELVARKVEKLVVMGGRYPTDPELTDFNLSDGPYRDGRTARAVIEAWPTEIVFSGSEIGDEIYTGSRLVASLPENPVARAYDLYPGTNELGERRSWDLTAVLYAVRPEAGLWNLRSDRQLVVDDDGSHAWLPGAVTPRLPGRKGLAGARQRYARHVAGAGSAVAFSDGSGCSSPPAVRLNATFSCCAFTQCAGWYHLYNAHNTKALLFKVYIQL